MGQSVRIHDQAAAELSRAEKFATEARTRRASAQETVSRAAVAVAEIHERRSRVAAELVELERMPIDRPADLVDRLRSGGWVSPEALEMVPAEAGAAVAAVLGDVERALTWKPGADAIVAEAAGEARLLASAHEQPTGRAEALAAVGATQTLAELVDSGNRAPRSSTGRVAPDLASLLSGWAALPDGWAAVTLDRDLADARGIVTVRGRAETATAAERSARIADLQALAQRLAMEAVEVEGQRAAAESELARGDRGARCR